MKYLAFLLSAFTLVSSVYAGPEDKWVYVGEGTFDGIALLLAVGAFVWFYVIYRDFKGKSFRRK